MAAFKDAVGGEWAGDYMCSICRKKRLTARCFSRKQLDRLRANKLTEDQLKCTECVNKAATEERQKAALKASLRASQEGAAKATGATEGLLKCSVCEKQLSQSEFTNTQANKPDASRKCRCCTAAAEESEKVAIAAAKRDKAQAAASAITATGVAGKLASAALECALEAEQVTGLRPMKGAGKGRGRGRGRGRRGSWRGRGSA